MRVTHSRVLKSASAIAACAALLSPLWLATPAHAWWRGGVYIGVPPPVYYAPRPYYPPPVYYPPPAYYAPPIYPPPPPYYPPPRAVWIPGHWVNGYYVRGRWG